jgi:hypothetical protein
MALQPALQLVSRVLYTNPPFWTALLDVRTRHAIDPAKMPHGARWTRFSDYFDPATPQPSTCHLHETLRAHNFDLVAAVASLLSDRLALSLHDGASEWANQKGQRVSLVSSCVDGRTKVDGWSGRGWVSPGTKIYVMIAIQMIWPLLAPCFTEKEKAASSLAIATVMLHELAVSFSSSHWLSCAMRLMPVIYSMLPIVLYASCFWATRVSYPYGNCRGSHLRCTKPSMT